MRDRTRETRHAVAIDGLGFVAGVTTFLALYGHLWLGAANGSAGELVLLFSDSVAAERSTMETLRLAGTIATVVSLGLLAAVLRRHENPLDAPRRQIKMGVAVSLAMILSGSVLYVLVSDVVVEALGLTLLAYGLLLLGVGSLYLVRAKPD
jgi:FtsH-binding integral membrane protein